MKRPTTSRFLLVFITVIVAAALSACGVKETNQATGSGKQVNSASGQPAPTDKTEQISVYFTDDDMADLKEQKVEIRYANDTQKLEAAFAALQKNETKQQISLWKHVQLLSVKIDGGMATFDIHLPDEARLGAPGEELALDAIEKTMFQFDGIGSIDILVDGQKIDSLMGHMELDHPITKP